MWIADGWKDYEVLDTSGGEKLERWGDYLLVRPDPQALTMAASLPTTQMLFCFKAASTRSASA